ncbi:MliC family protein [Rhizobium sp. S163]|uniref:MliC family protein n=1 Tax=Rhizobium sp. S163 TaxID=3055039 RepID=UPI0025A96335|nr:MliC family protein [Rhizobium sp. S163]MDM9646359.1 MliC family protein [Rhizobium sp. S163]
MKIAEGLSVAIGILAATSPALAMDDGTIQLKSTSNIERQQVAYDCAEGGKLGVTYVNADPNFLAVVPLPGERQPIVFVSVMSGSGARYASGKFVWWTKGATARLFDITAGENAPAVMTCTAKG